MKITFLIKSESVNIDKYTIKDIPGSSGRLDVISRCILSSIIKDNGFEENIQIHIFFDNYGTFVFNPNLLSFSTFPKNELMLSDCIVQIIKTGYNKNKLIDNPLKQIKVKRFSMIDFLKNLKKRGDLIFVLKEDGEDYLNLIDNKHPLGELYFIIGNQSEDLINSEEFLKLKIPSINIGTKSYLASSVIRIIKFNLKILFS
ncbi:MAG: hypothetical protein KGD63_12650 [Candidatus Lokiarchaeota archaeon]|nr:hypothetical protein [Candidatus Lokiarchaeota archaeon]